ncbi:hypothetical protein ABIC94_003746 [Variovorax paradoxus]|uniref:hypothetical protein n=1 Tax=Variovorax paradoxus TaxID=34073 RepID=UPI003396F4AA
MTSSPLHDALLEAGFAERYYQLCAKHENRKAERCQCPHSEIVATLSDLGELAKERGPGRTYTIRAPGLPVSVEFGFSIKGEGVYIEPYLNLQEDSVRSGSNYAVLAFGSITLAGKQPPKLPYPRPFFFSVSELREVVAGCLEIARQVSARVEAKGGSA